MSDDNVGGWAVFGGIVLGFVFLAAAAAVGVWGWEAWTTRDDIAEVDEIASLRRDIASLRSEIDDFRDDVCGFGWSCSNVEDIDRDVVSLSGEIASLRSEIDDFRDAVCGQFSFGWSCSNIDDIKRAVRVP